MDRVVHVLTFHNFDQKSYATYHDYRVAGLDGYDYVIEFFPSADTQKFHTALYDTFGRVAITAHDAVAERTMVHSDTQSCMVFPTDIQQGNEALFYLAKFAGIFFVGIFQMFESTCRISIIARVDTDFFCIKSGYFGYFGIEMHIGNKGDIASGRAYCCIDFFQIFSFSHALCGQPYVFSAGFSDAQCLCSASCCVECRRVGHALDPDRILAAKRCLADMYYVGSAPVINEESHGCNPPV